MTSLEQINQLAKHASKVHIEGIAHEAVHDVMDSKQDVLEWLAMAARNAHFWTTFRDQLKPFASERITKSVSVDKVTFSVVNAGKIDYSSDPTWSELERQIQNLRAEQKEVEKVLKKQKFDTSEVDESTGEVFEIGHADRAGQKKTVTIKF